MELLRNEFSRFGPFSFPPGRPARALVGVSSAARRDELAGELQREGYAVGEASTGLELLAQLAVERIDLVLIDPELPGTTVLDALPAGANGPKVIVLGAAGSPQLNTQVQRLRAAVLDPASRVSTVIDCALQLVSPVQLDPH
ncbi:MAG: response regulator [Myxococcaceae bacterium]